MSIYIRDTKEIIAENEVGTKALDILYKTWYGRVILKTVAARPWFSNVGAAYQRSKMSAKKIRPFIEQYGVDVSNWNVNDFKSFEEFFTRKRENTTTAADNELVAIADSKLTVYDISDELVLNIKQSKYTLSELLDDSKESYADFAGGKCLIFRLAVDDYHRYSFPDSGKITGSKYIKGMLHTVRSIAEEYKVYSRNCREVTWLDTDNFGKVITIEVGAMMVGKINNHPLTDFKKLDEKGYFSYGGSTAVMLVGKDVKIDEDILEMTAKGIETKVRVGDIIGRI